jgi:hypothetical protein
MISTVHPRDAGWKEKLLVGEKKVITMFSRTKTTARRMLQPESHVETADSRWNWLYKIGGAAALSGVAIYLIHLIVFIVWGQPETAIGWFTLFESSKLGGSWLSNSCSSSAALSQSRRPSPSTLPSGESTNLSW